MSRLCRLFISLVSLALCLASSSVIGANAPLYRFSNMTVGDGLSQSSVFAVAQDSHDNIWLGTDDGLNLYDGYEFIVLNHIPGDDKSLANNSVSSIFIDSDGVVWVGTRTGLSRFDYGTFSFDNYSLSGLDIHVYDIAESHDGEQLILAADIGVVIFDKRTARLDVKTYMQGVDVQSICVSGESALIGTSHGLFRYLIDYGTVEEVVEELKNCDIACVIPASDGGFWVGTFGQGIYRLDASLVVVEQINSQSSGGALSDYVRVIRADSEQRLWIGTFDGLSIYNISTGEFVADSRIKIENNTRSNSVRSIFIDSQNGVWVGTFYGGVNYYHPLLHKFSVMRHDGGGNSLSSNTISCMKEDPSGCGVWIATNDAGLNYYDYASERVSTYDVRDGLLSNNIKTLHFDSSLLWIGTHAGGLGCMNLKTHRITNYTLRSDIPINNSCYSILDNGDGTLLLGTLNGLLLFDKESRRVINQVPLFAKSDKRLSSEQILSIYRDSRRRVWIGTDKLIYMCSSERGDVRSFMPSEDGKSLAVMCVMEDSQGTIWAGTKGGGVARYDEASESFVFITTTEKLPNNTVYGILEDELHRLWISTNLGLACFSRDMESVRCYSEIDGLSCDQFNPYSFCKTRSGKFYFGGIDGVTCFTPHAIIDNPFAPKPQIRGFNLLNKQVAGSDSQRRVSVIRDSRNEIAEVRFPSKLDLFSIEFAVVNPLSGGHNTYSYSLEGFDSEWYSTTSTEISYSNLPAGGYTFHVRACNNDGVWCDEATRLEVRILPMWYQTIFAKVVYVLLILGVTIVVIYVVVSRMRMKMELKFERMESRRIDELNQEKIRLYINFAHELQTPLSLILSPLEDIRDHGTTDSYVASRLRYVHRSSMKLLHVVNQLLSYRKAELGMYRTRVAVQDMNAIIGDIFALFEETAQNRDMDYILSSEIQGQMLPADRMFTEMILTNLLSNAFKFTPDGGMIRVSVTHTGHNIAISVRDSGRGIPKSERERIFDRFYQSDDTLSGTGIGLAIVKRLVELLKGSISVASDGRSYSEFVVMLPDTIDIYSADELAPPDEVQSAKIENVTLYLDEQPSNVEKDDDESAPRREKLLIVSDDEEIMRYVVESFRSRYLLFTADDYRMASDLLREHEPDVVIAYLNDRNMSGIRLCRSIKQNLRTCHIPVIVLGAEDTSDSKLQSLEAGADAYLAQPLSMSLLNAKVMNLLKSKYRLQHYYSNSMEVEPDKITSNTMDGEFLKKAVQIVEQNIGNEEFSSNDFAKALCMSRSNLHLKMTSITGESATKFIRKIRFNYACRLLLERRYSIAEISSMVGFNSPSYFATSFKKHVGCLPTEYVKKSL